LFEFAGLALRPLLGFVGIQWDTFIRLSGKNFLLVTIMNIRFDVNGFLYDLDGNGFVEPAVSPSGDVRSARREATEALYRAVVKKQTFSSTGIGEACLTVGFGDEYRLMSRGKWKNNGDFLPKDRTNRVAQYVERAAIKYKVIPPKEEPEPVANNAEAVAGMPPMD